MSVLITGFSSAITAAVLLTAPGAFATQVGTPNERVVSQAEAEALLNFRIEGVVERHSLPRCSKNLKMMGDERLLDPQLPACDAMNSFGRLNLDECTKPDGTMPLNRRYLRELPRGKTHNL
jgi:hypothetical protein